MIYPNFIEKARFTNNLIVYIYVQSDVTFAIGTDLYHLSEPSLIHCPDLTFQYQCLHGINMYRKFQESFQELRKYSSKK